MAPGEGLTVRCVLETEMSVMSTGKPRYYVTTPIYYVNDVPHIGPRLHDAGLRRAGAVQAASTAIDVRFLTGTDEHGQKVEKSAAAAGVEPQAFTDQVSQNFRHLVAAS